MQLRRHTRQIPCELPPERLQISTDKGGQGKTHHPDRNAHLVSLCAVVIEAHDRTVLDRRVIAKEIILPLMLLPHLRERKPIQFLRQCIEHCP